ncbi:hypothetical protein ACFLZG_06975 [Thermodesulfobacteriota bacterium]
MSIEVEKEACPDCRYCQMCSKSRCRLCRNNACEERTSELGTGFTYGQYMEWKMKKCRLDKDSRSTAGG